jgi:hypothetical protein
MEITFDLYANLDDAELFVLFDQIPDPDNGLYQFRSQGETIYRAEPLPGRYYMVISVYQTLDNAALEVQYTLNSEQ